MSLIIIKPRAMVFFKDRKIINAVQTTLCKSGWNVDGISNLSDVLEFLGVSRNNPYSVFISGPGLIKSHYDELSMMFKKISYTLHKMFIIFDADKKDLVPALNIGHVQVCLVHPFKKAHLISQAKICFRHYRKEQKQQQLKKQAARQAKKLYTASMDSKIKWEHNKRLIDKKQTSIETLKDHKLNLTSNIALDDYLVQKKIPFTPANLRDQFLICTIQIQEFVEKMAVKHSAEWETPDLKAIIQDDKKTFDYPDIIEMAKNYALMKALKTDLHVDASEMLIDRETMDDYVELVISEDLVTAYLEPKKRFSDEIVNLNSILEYLDQHQISFGVLEEKKIVGWLNDNQLESDRIIIAQGKKAVSGKDGILEYFFETDYTNPGKILADGSIDFKDRGEVPYVEKGTLLARKKPPVEGIVGIDVFGNDIIIEEPIDPVFIAGSGARFSDDKLEVFADKNGQPYVDVIGTITVNEEFVIRGDVDHKTGNVDFDGNIIVSGTIKDGFKVKGINLTASEIEGAIIELTGDLNVSNGITNASIITVGNIQTKFINHSSILGFGNFNVLREIIDSDIILGGECDVSNGHIIASSLSAKCGIKARNIGTVSSSPADLRVGFNDHIRKIEAKLEKKIKVSLGKISFLQNKIEQLNAKTQEMHKGASEQSLIREKSQVEIQQCERQLLEIEASSDTQLVHETIASIDALKKKVDDVKNRENQLLKQSNKIEAEMVVCKEKKHQIEEEKAIYTTEKKQLEESKKKRNPNPVVVVGKTIVQRTKIASPKAVLILDEDESRCTIREIKNVVDNVPFYELQVICNT